MDGSYGSKQIAGLPTLIRQIGFSYEGIIKDRYSDDVIRCRITGGHFHSRGNIEVQSPPHQQDLIAADMNTAFSFHLPVLEGKEDT
jgi:hypothetical protein